MFHCFSESKSDYGVCQTRPNLFCIWIGQTYIFECNVECGWHIVRKMKMPANTQLIKMVPSSRATVAKLITEYNTKETYTDHDSSHNCGLWSIEYIEYLLYGIWRLSFLHHYGSPSIHSITLEQNNNNTNKKSAIECSHINPHLCVVRCSHMKSISKVNYIYKIILKIIMFTGTTFCVWMEIGEKSTNQYVILQFTM